MTEMELQEQYRQETNGNIYTTADGEEWYSYAYVDWLEEKIVKSALAHVMQSCDNCKREDCVIKKHIPLNGNKCVEHVA